MALGDQRAGQLAQVEQPAGQRRHVAAWYPRRRLVMQRHPKRQPLPLHAAAQDAVGPADDAVGRQE